MPKPGASPIYGFNLDDLDDLAGYVAAEANHAKNKKLQKELQGLYNRVAAVLESYTDEDVGHFYGSVVFRELSIKVRNGYTITSDPPKR